MASQAGPAAPPARVRSRRSSWWSRNQRKVMPFVFLAPFFVIYTAFLIWPIISALDLSFKESVGFDPASYTGLDNYAELLGDERYRTALSNTTIYALASVFVLSPLALLAAVAIRSFIVARDGMKTFYRVVFFMPFITSLVVIALMFSLIFNAEYGVLNNALASVGLPRVDWLQGENTALLSVTMVGIWTYLGINSLYFLAGLQNIPEELEEAARVDGARRLQVFRFVTLPLLRPVILFVVVQATIFGYQLFELPYLLTAGGPGDSTLTIAIYLYETGFREFDRGYAAAVGYSMALIAVVLTAIELGYFRWRDRERTPKAKRATGGAR